MASYNVHTRTRHDRRTWKTRLRDTIVALRDECPNLDLRPESDFVKREVYRATHLVLAYDETHLVGAAFAQFHARAIEVLLIWSRRGGIGTGLMTILESNPEWHQPMIFLRSVRESLFFYLKRHYALFDYRQHDMYLSGQTDAVLTEMLWRDPDAVHIALVSRHWMPDVDEYPLLKWRSVAQDPRARRSARLKRGIGASATSDADERTNVPFGRGER